ncbi:restriction endonuclease subunit S, partial [Providencia rettgeri]
MSEWVEYSLEDVAEITSSKRIFYADYVDYGIPFYRSKEIIELYNRSEISNSLYISEQKYLEIKEKYGVPVIGDILLTSVGTLGIPYLVNNSNEFYFKDGNLTWIRKINKNIVLPDFIYCLLNSPLGKNKLDEITIGSTQAALTIAGLKKIKISVPNLSEQLEIVHVIQSISKKIELLHRQNKTLESMAETLFRQWFADDSNGSGKEVELHEIIEFNPKGTVANRIVKLSFSAQSGLKSEYSIH